MSEFWSCLKEKKSLGFWLKAVKRRTTNTKARQYLFNGMFSGILHCPLLQVLGFNSSSFRISVKPSHVLCQSILVFALLSTVAANLGLHTLRVLHPGVDGGWIHLHENWELKLSELICSKHLESSCCGENWCVIGQSQNFIHKIRILEIYISLEHKIQNSRINQHSSHNLGN